MNEGLARIQAGMEQFPRRNPHVDLNIGKYLTTNNE